jgi:hypothetical protein
MTEHIHAVLKLTVNCAVNTVSSTAANVKGIIWNFSRGLDISVFMLDILTVVGNQTTRLDYCFSDFVRLYFNVFRKSFCVKTIFTCLSLPSRTGGGGQQLAVKWSVEFHTD